MNSNQLFSSETAAADEKNQGRVRVKIAVFSIVAVHVAGLMALLLTQGCRPHKEAEPQPDVPTMDTNALPPMDTNIPPSVATNVVVPEPQQPPLVQPDVAAPTATKYVVQA